jgi:hypothetical protein
VEALMPHAIQIRQTGGPEVLNWTPIRRLARELKQQKQRARVCGECGRRRDSAGTVSLARPLWAANGRPNSLTARTG